MSCFGVVIALFRRRGNNGQDGRMAAETVALTPQRGYANAMPDNKNLSQKNGAENGQESQKKEFDPTRYGSYSGPVATIEDFEVIKHIGSGAYGEVGAARKTCGVDQGEIYAMKVMEKKRMIKHEDMVQHEWKILTTIENPFFMSMKYSFQTNRHLIFVMTLAGGGDMLTLIEKECLSEPSAHFYLCELVEAVGYLHSQHIIHRDIKLENLLVANDGHLLVTDYGLAATNKFAEDSTEGLIGTRHTMAPEIHLKKKYGPSCDWWAVGITYCDMRSDKPCFDGDTSTEYSESTVKRRPRLPKCLSPRERGFLNRLIVRNPSQRLGTGPDGTMYVKRHDIFKAVNWDDVVAKKMVPPFVPNQEMIKNFKCFPESAKNASFPTFEHPTPIYWPVVDFTAEALL
uniref:Protein kinase domain-containing protein n=1 Tax=Caenorhabditis tropicalis TaxID=1561998 RepID=A0A1I7UPU6_9PELO